VEIDLRSPFQSVASIDSQGVYRIAGVPPGNWTVTASSGERALSERVSMPSQAKKAVLDFTFPPTWEVSGRVSGPTGEPVANAAVRLFVSPGGPKAPGGWAYSRSDGSFRMELEDGTYHGRAAHLIHFRSILKEPVIVDGGPVDGVELQLGTAARVRGRILGLEPDEGVKSIGASGPNDVGREGKSDRQSGYVLYQLTPGTWTITAITYRGRQATGQVTVQEGVTEIELDLEF
jgi:hypothetical protein